MNAVISVTAGVSAALCSVLLAQEWSWNRIGLEGMWIESVATPPDSADVIYASRGPLYESTPVESLGVYKSTDGGETWRFLPESMNPVCGALTIDSRDQATVYLGSNTYVYTSLGWCRRTRDAGEHWEQFEGKTFYRIVPSPWNPGRLLATETFGGNYVLALSVDDGQTWQDICGGSEALLVTSNVVFSWADSLVVFACVYERAAEGRFGLCRSRDGGLTWEEVLRGTVCGFDQDPRDGNHWVAVADCGTGSLRFWESFDEGDTWHDRPAIEGMYDVEQVVFDPYDSQVLYLAGVRTWDMQGVFRSGDGGHAWEPMNEGLPNVLFHCELVPVRNRPGELLLARWDGLWLWTDRVVAEEAPLAKAGVLRIEAVRPCPFRERVTARFACEAPGVVSAAVYSLEGRLMRTLMENTTVAGSHLLTWDGLTSSGLPAGPGAYVVRVASPGAAAEALVIRVP